MFASLDAYTALRNRAVSRMRILFQGDRMMTERIRIETTARRSGKTFVAALDAEISKTIVERGGGAARPQKRKTRILRP